MKQKEVHDRCCSQPGLIQTRGRFIGHDHVHLSHHPLPLGLLSAPFCCLIPTRCHLQRRFRGCLRARRRKMEVQEEDKSKGKAPRPARDIMQRPRCAGGRKFACQLLTHPRRLAEPHSQSLHIVLVASDERRLPRALEDARSQAGSHSLVGR